MSYDLRIYCAQNLESDALAALITQVKLAVAPDSDPSDDVVPLVRGRRGSYCCTLQSPVLLEAEDVPEEISGLMLGARFLLEVSVEGSAEADIPHAIRLARRLAEATGGVVEDPQTDAYWSRGKLRSVAPVERGRVDVIEMNWYAPAAAVEAAPRGWLKVARRCLPEALPRRFGGTEPLQGRLDRDGDEKFAEVATEEGMIFFAPTLPFTHGSLRGSVDDDAQVTSFSLHAIRDPFDDPRWLQALRRYFVEFADQVGAFAATCELVRGHEWSGRTVWGSVNTERSAFPAPLGKWMGLPPYPVSWLWLGSEYLDLLRPHLDAASVTPFGVSGFVQFSASPVGRNVLPAHATLPADFLARDLTPPGSGYRSYTLKPAERMPADLRPDLLEREILALATATAAAGALSARTLDLSTYRAFATPYGLEFSSLTPRQARQTFEFLMHAREERIRELRALVEANGFSTATTDDFLRGVDALLSVYPSTEPHADWSSIGIDAALLLGDALIARHPHLHWRISSAGKRYGDHQAPVIGGMRNAGLSGPDAHVMQITFNILARAQDGDPHPGFFSTTYPGQIAAKA
ncbi:MULTISPECIES: hypothetical protein [unclassified Microbacterium]|uniref:hypothetical protein n=1 Tax=unclassified Microbacterium TaxID=2609290 RepID=UPI0012F9615B|nr:hypothetical protein [Microbacterium sp. MAH-37]MVQ40672.1 hypothetical protein [Microbacterium sp. MAH-37]